MSAENLIKRITRWLDGDVSDTSGDLLREALAALTSATSQQEPVAYMWQHDETGRVGPLYTAPQPAERKPLTEERIRRLHAFDSCLPDLVGVRDQWPEILRFARAVEKAHGIPPADAKEVE